MASSPTTMFQPDTCCFNFPNAAAVGGHQHLETLILSANNASDKGVQALIAALAHNSSIKDITLNHNPAVTTRVARHLRQTLATRLGSATHANSASSFSGVAITPSRSSALCSSPTVDFAEPARMEVGWQEKEADANLDSPDGDFNSSQDSLEASRDFTPTSQARGLRPRAPAAAPKIRLTLPCSPQGEADAASTIPHAQGECEESTPTTPPRSIEPLRPPVRLATAGCGSSSLVAVEDAASQEAVMANGADLGGLALSLARARSLSATRTVLTIDVLAGRSYDLLEDAASTPAAQPVVTPLPPTSAPESQPPSPAASLLQPTASRTTATTAIGPSRPSVQWGAAPGPSCLSDSAETSLPDCTHIDRQFAQAPEANSVDEGRLAGADMLRGNAELRAPTDAAQHAAADPRALPLPPSRGQAAASARFEGAARPRAPASLSTTSGAAMSGGRVAAGRKGAAGQDSSAAGDRLGRGAGSLSQGWRERERERQRERQDGEYVILPRTSYLLSYSEVQRVRRYSPV